MDFDGFCHILSSAQSTDGLGPRNFSMQIPILDCHRSIQTGCRRFFANPQMVFTGKSSPSSPETMVFTIVFTMVFTGVSCNNLTDVPWKTNPMIERLSYFHPQVEKKVLLTMKLICDDYMFDGMVSNTLMEKMDGKDQMLSDGYTCPSILGWL